MLGQLPMGKARTFCVPFNNSNGQTCLCPKQALHHRHALQRTQYKNHESNESRTATSDVENVDFDKSKMSERRNPSKSALGGCSHRSTCLFSSTCRYIRSTCAALPCMFDLISCLSSFPIIIHYTCSSQKMRVWTSCTSSQKRALGSV